MNLFKFRSTEQIEHSLDILLNERLYCAPYDQLNDPLEGIFYTLMVDSGMMESTRRYQTLAALPKYDADTRLCSLTADVSDVRMWSYYASGHEGLAIEIDFSDQQNDLTKVKYEEALQQFGEAFLKEADAKTVLSFKTKHWDYEKEYRVIQADTYYSIKNRIKSVYLGVKISEQLKDILTKALPKKTPLYTTRIDKKTIAVRKEASV